MSEQSDFGFIDVVSCNDSLMWYASKVGKRLPLARPYWQDKDDFLCNEDSGLLNIVKKKDAIYISEINANGSKK